jgi:hypothetical protein
LILQNTYSQNFFGKITSVDVSNTFKILVFFKEFNIIIILDNNLSVINNLDLSLFEFSEIQQVCSSMQSGFWFYDNSEKRIFLLDEKFCIQQKSKYLGKYISESEVIELVEKKNKLYLGIKNKGVLIFDNNANFDNFVKFNLESSFSILSDSAFIYLDQESGEIRLKKIEESDLYIFDNFDDIKDFKINNSDKIVLTEDSLFIKI